VIEMMNSKIYVLPAKPAGYKLWEQEPILDGIIYKRRLNVAGVSLYEAVSVGMHPLMDAELDHHHYFEARMPAVDLERIVRTISGVTPIWKRQNERRFRNGNLADGYLDEWRDTPGWLINYNIPIGDIINPDGWDRTDLGRSFSEMITEDEFEARLRNSTLKSSPAVNSFLYRKNRV
jgi:hypothetical protein